MRRAPSQAKQKKPPAQREEKYYGVAACRGLWRKRARDIIRIYLTAERVPEFSDLLKWAAQQRKAYHIVTDEDMERLTRSEHHQGICLLTLERAVYAFADWWQEKSRARPAASLLVYLDGVENPHNLGAIVRTCAHFGVGAVLGDAAQLPRLSPSAYRVAEGGAEFVDMVGLDNPAAQLGVLRKAGYELLAAHAAPGANSLFAYKFAAHCVLILGAELTGVSPMLARLSSQGIQIPGTGQVESLNVSTAAAIIIGEYHRQRAPVA
ncbi:MAG: TrmH family RNA methyltransferase [Pseudomonadota bacterium]